MEASRSEDPIRGEGRIDARNETRRFPERNAPDPAGQLELDAAGLLDVSRPFHVRTAPESAPRRAASA